MAWDGWTDGHMVRMNNNIFIQKMVVRLLGGLGGNDLCANVSESVDTFFLGLARY